VETEPKVDLEALAVSPARVESCVAAVVARGFAPPPTLWDGLVWAGRYALAAGLLLAAAAWLFSSVRRPEPAAPPPTVPAYAPFPEAALLTLGSRGEVDAP
jgi:hypothetical protein